MGVLRLLMQQLSPLQAAGVYSSQTPPPGSHGAGRQARSRAGPLHRAAEGKQHMPSEYDATTQAFRLVSGSYRCTVRHAGTGQWLAVIRAGGQGADAFSFDTQAAAQAQCGQQREVLPLLAS